MTRIKMSKSVIILLCAVLICAVTVGTTLAFIFAKAPPVVNEFEPVFVSCSVEEGFVNNVKSNVRVRNTGDISAYIRACVVICWVSETDGSINGASPVKDRDYLITYSDSWTQGSDGFYYFTSPVAAGDATDILIYDARPAEDADIPEGYKLSVQIVASAIQAQPAEAVSSAWGATISNGQLIPA